MKKISLFRSSVEKVYGWKERDGLPGHSETQMGLLEVWFHISGKGKGEVDPSQLSGAGQRAVKFLWKAKHSGWIA